MYSLKGYTYVSVENTATLLYSGALDTSPSQLHSRHGVTPSSTVHILTPTSAAI